MTTTTTTTTVELGGQHLPPKCFWKWSLCFLEFRLFEINSW